MKISALNTKFMNIFLASSMVLTTSPQAFSMTEEATEHVYFAKQYEERKSELKSDLISKYEKEVDQKIAMIKLKLDQALDQAIAEIDADRKTRKIKKESYSRVELAAGYLERHQADNSQSALGKVLDQDIKTVLKTMSLEEKYVMKLKVAQLLRLKNYGDKYNRKVILAGALVGFAIGAAISIKISEPGMANGFNNVLGGMIVTMMSTIAGTLTGDYFNIDVELVENAEQLQKALVEKADSLNLEADSDLDTLVENKYYPNLKM